MKGFAPVLLCAESSTDMLSKGETLFVTTTWRNMGDAPAALPVVGRLELVLGHQRTMETATQTYTQYWEPYPAASQWLPGMTVRTTCRFRANPDWCGTFHMTVSLCDEHHVPLSQRPVAIGDVDIGWGYGYPMVENTRKGWTVIYGAPPQDCMNAEPTHGVRARAEAALSLTDGIECAAQFPGLERFGAFDLCPQPPTLQVRMLGDGDDKPRWLSEVAWQAESAGGDLLYQGSARQGGEEVVACTLRFAAKDAQHLRVTMENVREARGMELLEVHLPSLLAAAGQGLSIAEFYGGGRLIQVAQTPPMHVRHPYDTRNAAAMIRECGVLALESPCIDDGLTVSVREVNGVKSGEIGCVLVHRVRGRGSVPSIRVEHDHGVTVCAVERSFGPPSWQAVARFWQQDVAAGTGHALYNRALVTKFLATWGPAPRADQVHDDSPQAVTQLNKVLPFEEIGKILRKLDHLLDGMPKVAYIGGFQRDGFDADYPFVYDTDPRAGTVSQLQQVIRDGGEHHAIVGLHDNYDSDVAGEHYDARIVCMDERGQPWRGWIWAGGLDYIVSPSKYEASGLMQERVEKTIALYGLRDSYHIDVLTSELRRYDFDPACPASAQRNLAGKLAIIEAYNRHGIDITSETVLHPFVGKIGYGLWLRDDRKDLLFPGEEYIPLTAMVYHGVTGYCGQSGNPTDMLWALVRGNQYFFEENHTSSENLRWVYLQTLPLGLLHARRIEDIRMHGPECTVLYGKDTRITVNFALKTYEILVDGDVVGKDWATLAPGFRPDTWLAYSLQGGDFRMRAPGGLSGPLSARVLTEEGPGESLPCWLEDGVVCMETPALTPVRIMKA